MEFNELEEGIEALVDKKVKEVLQSNINKCVGSAFKLKFDNTFELITKDLRESLVDKINFELTKLKLELPDGIKLVTNSAGFLVTETYDAVENNRIEINSGYTGFKGDSPMMYLPKKARYKLVLLAFEIPEGE